MGGTGEDHPNRDQRGEPRHMDISQHANAPTGPKHTLYSRGE